VNSHRFEARLYFAQPKTLAERIAVEAGGHVAEEVPQ